jgi:molybdopterin/thiamine biosynthesis adenylyltransferase
VYRTAVDAIDNAEAIPAGNEYRVGSIESSAAGVGRAEVQRRTLTEQDMIESSSARPRAAPQQDYWRRRTQQSPNDYTTRRTCS